MDNQHYMKKFFDICRYINDNFLVEEIFWETVTIILRIQNYKYIAIKVPQDNPNNIYCFAAVNDITPGPLSIPEGGEPILSFKDLKKYIKKVEKNIGFVNCPQCNTQFIPD